MAAKNLWKKNILPKIFVLIFIHAGPKLTYTQIFTLNLKLTPNLTQSLT